MTHSRSFRRTLIAVFSVLAAAGSVAAQHFPSEADLYALIKERVDAGRGIGIVLGVIEADGSRTIVAYGDAGPGAHPLGPKSVFEIGSISKVFTGILLADMAARGRLALDDPVADYVPDGATMPSRNGRVITFTDIATHRSGIPRMPDNFSPADPANPYADYTPELLFEFISGLTLTRDIGERYEYSNLAVGLMGQVLARTDLERAMRVSHESRRPAGPDMTIGLDWHIRASGDDQVVWHNGGTGGYRTFVGFDPASGVGTVVLTNSGHGADDIGFHMLNPAFSLAPPPEPSVERTEIEVGPEMG